MKHHFAVRALSLILAIITISIPILARAKMRSTSIASYTPNAYFQKKTVGDVVDQLVEGDEEAVTIFKRIAADLVPSTKRQHVFYLLDHLQRLDSGKKLKLKKRILKRLEQERKVVRSSEPTEQKPQFSKRWSPDAAQESSGGDDFWGDFGKTAASLALGGLIVWVVIELLEEMDILDDDEEGEGVEAEEKAAEEEPVEDCPATVETESGDAGGEEEDC